jgi:streptomycin 6-kinase
MRIPRQLVDGFHGNPEAKAWLERLPKVIAELESRWELTLGEPFDGEHVSCSWVAPATRADGSTAIFKVGWPHMEAEHEVAGLRYWDGDSAVRVFETDEPENAFVMERCFPGTRLRELSLETQDQVVATVLKRLWRRPAEPHPFRPLADQMRFWTDEALAEVDNWPDAGLVREGLQLYEALSRPSPDDVLLATDLHASNILAAQREPWLVIDPKPFIGDRAYDITQHLLNDLPRLLINPAPSLQFFADRLELDPLRIRLWLFARAAVMSCHGSEQLALARALAP